MTRAASIRLTALAAVALSVALAMTTVDAAPAAAQRVYACRHTPSGILFNFRTSTAQCSDVIRQLRPAQNVSFKITGPQGPRGQQGQRGRQGKRGEEGQPGATGAIGPRGERGQNGNLSTYAVSAIADGPAGALAAEATCDSGDVATGGGFQASGPVSSSLGLDPEDGPQGWALTALGETEDAGGKSYVVCVDNPPLRP
jgi:hypothetical protein